MEFLLIMKLRTSNSLFGIDLTGRSVSVRTFEFSILCVTQIFFPLIRKLNRGRRKRNEKVFLKSLKFSSESSLITPFLPLYSTPEFLQSPQVVFFSRARSFLNLCTHCKTGTTVCLRCLQKNRVNESGN